MSVGVPVLPIGAIGGPLHPSTVRAVATPLSPVAAAPMPVRGFGVSTPPASALGDQRGGCSGVGAVGRVAVQRGSRTARGPSPRHGRSCSPRPCGRRRRSPRRTRTSRSTRRSRRSTRGCRARPCDLPDVLGVEEVAHRRHLHGAGEELRALVEHALPAEQRGVVDQDVDLPRLIAPLAARSRSPAARPVDVARHCDRPSRRCARSGQRRPSLSAGSMSLQATVAP